MVWISLPSVHVDTVNLPNLGRAHYLAYNVARKSMNACRIVFNILFMVTLLACFTWSQALMCWVSSVEFFTNIKYKHVIAWWIGLDAVANLSHLVTNITLLEVQRDNFKLPTNTKIAFSWRESTSLVSIRINAGYHDWESWELKRQDTLW